MIFEWKQGLIWIQFELETGVLRSEKKTKIKRCARCHFRQRWDDYTAAGSGFGPKRNPSQAVMDRIIFLFLI